jgi:hypothetical protein
MMVRGCRVTTTATLLFIALRNAASKSSKVFVNFYFVALPFFLNENMYWAKIFKSKNI